MTHKKQIIAFYGKAPSAAEINQIFLPKNGVKYKEAVPVPASVSLVSSDFSDPDIEENSIAYHPVFGDIRMDSWWRFSTRQFMKDLKAAEENPAVAAHLIHVNSPGGEAFGMKECYDLIRSLQKPVIGLVDGMACSAGYYILAGCDKIFASSIFSMVGCIGCMAIFYNDDKMLEDWGYEVHEYYSHHSPLKNKVFNDAANGEGEDYVSRFLDPMAKQFIDDVSAARGDVSEAALQGETFYATEAMAAGLIDGENSLEETVEYIHKIINNPIPSININDLDL